MRICTSKGALLTLMTGVLVGCVNPQTVAPEMGLSPPNVRGADEESRKPSDQATPEGLVRLAEDLEAHGETDAALNLYEQAAAGSQSPTAYLLLGDACLRANQVGKAVQAYRTVVAKQPSNGHGLLGLGSALARQGEFEQGIASLKMAAEIDSGPTAYHRLGVAHAMAGQFNEAEAALIQALDRAPEDLDIAVNLALAQALANRHDKAIELMRRVVAVPTADSRYKRNFVLVLALAGRTKEARAAAPQDTPESKIDAIIDRADLIREKTSPRARARALGLSFAQPEAPASDGSKKRS